METLTVVLQQQILKLLCECDEALLASNRGSARSKDAASSARARAHYFERYKLYSKLLPRLKGKRAIFHKLLARDAPRGCNRAKNASVRPLLVIAALNRNPCQVYYRRFGVPEMDPGSSPG